MPRSRTIPDETVHVTIRRMLAEGGDKAVSFATVAQATGLAASTLAQRFGTRDGMVKAALIDGWEKIEAATTAAEGEAAPAPKAIPVLLKLIGRGREAEISILVSRLRDAELRDAAAAWRAHVEAAIAVRLGDGAKAKDGAAMIFAAWQGRLIWGGPGAGGFKLKDAIKRLGQAGVSSR